MQNLDRIARDDIDPENARTAIASALTVEGGPDAVLRALELWTWRAVDTRRRDTQLRDWHGVLRQTAARVARDGIVPPSVRRDVLCARIEVMARLISRSIEAAASLEEDVASTLAKAHVRTIIELLARPGKPVGRAAIKKATNLKDANLSRVLGDMTRANLVARKLSGREASFALTETGRNAYFASRHGSAMTPAEVAALSDELRIAFGGAKVDPNRRRVVTSMAKTSRKPRGGGTPYASDKNLMVVVNDAKYVAARVASLSKAKRTQIHSPMAGMRLTAKDGIREMRSNFRKSGYLPVSRTGPNNRGLEEYSNSDTMGQTPMPAQRAPAMSSPTKLLVLEGT